jgi:coenzyme F420-reducing hydrogenase alpha subunit
MKIVVPHIHKIEGEAGFWAKVTRTGKIEELKFQTLLGLRQIEGILVGRRYFEVPIVVSRICGICPVPHILAACSALEKALDVKVSEQTILLRKLLLAANIINSHTLHLFFLSLPDFFDIENDLDLMKKFKKETRAALKIRDFSLEITKLIGGRDVHPITPQIGGFSKLPEKGDLEKISKDLPIVLESAQILAKTFKNLSYPDFQRETSFASLFSEEEYPFYQANFIKSNDEKSTPGNFYSNEIEEDLKISPVKRVRYRGKPYMLGTIARIKNNSQFLNPLAKEYFEEFKKKNDLTEEKFFANIYHNLFCQMVEVLHFLEESQKLIKEILELGLKKGKIEFKIKKGSGLSAMEAPRGTLFTYFELDDRGRILNCNIITPTAQFIANLEEDLKILLPEILKIPETQRKKKIRSLIRVYDPCISCAVH